MRQPVRHITGEHLMEFPPSETGRLRLFMEFKRRRQMRRRIENVLFVVVTVLMFVIVARESRRAHLLHEHGSRACSTAR